MAKKTFPTIPNTEVIETSSDELFFIRIYEEGKFSEEDIAQ